MIVAIAGLLLALVAAPPADVKGTWDGTLTVEKDDGGTEEHMALLILDQKDTTITGRIGGSEGAVYPIASGSIDGNKVLIVARDPEGGEFRLELTLHREELKGTLTNGERHGRIEATRRKH
jgi:hypothetical protein